MTKLAAVPHKAKAKPRDLNDLAVAGELPEDLQDLCKLVSVPSWDPDAEAALLASLILDAAHVEPIFALIDPEHFGSTAHRWIARAIKAIWESAKPIDIVTVSSYLKDVDRIGEVGGTQYLATIVDNVPAVSLENVVSYAEIVRRKWESRTALTEARALVAKLEHGAVESVGEAVGQTLGRIAGLVVKSEAFEFPGYWATELGDPSAEPEREVWLLRDEVSGRPSLAMGRTALESASGGTGKTTTLVQLAVAVALGLSWAGFKVETPGCVVLACAESDAKLMRRQLWRAANSFGLSREQRERVVTQIVVMPLAGKEVNLLRGTAENDLERTEFLAQFRAHLEKLATDEGFAWSLIALDPLARFAGPDVERDNASATRFAQAIETLCTLPGSPAVIVAHHSSKNSIRMGNNDTRGVSGLRDAFRTELLLNKLITDTGLVGVQLHCGKSNEAPEFPDRWLVRQGREPLANGGWLDVGGTLRLATPTESAELDAAAGTRTTASPAERKESRQSASKTEFENDCDLVVSLIPSPPRSISSKELLGTVRASGKRWDHHKVTTFTSYLSGDKGGQRITDLSEGKQSTGRQWTRTEGINHE